MSNSQSKSSIKQMTRGGQTLLHNIRMISQIFHKILLVSLVLTLVWLVYWFFHATVPAQRIFLIKVAKSWLITKVKPDEKAQEFLQSYFVQRNLSYIYYQMLWALKIGAWIFSSTILTIFIWLRQRGRSYLKTEHIKGDEIAEPKEIATELIKTKQASDLNFAGLPLVLGTERQHMLFHGTTGAGKSNAIKILLDQIRARGEKAIIYDKSGNLIQQFYRENEDQILNPLDDRTECWDLWGECRDSVDFVNIAAAQIPMPANSSDPFWINAARTIFSSAAEKMQTESEPNIQKMLDTLLKSDLLKLEKFLKGTDAASLVTTKAEKTVASIRSVLSTYLRSLNYVKEGDNPISIRNWIKNDSNSNWLFISSVGDRHEVLMPLITMWLDVAVNTLLSLKPDENRRVWVILDELTSLNRIPYLGAAAAEGRKFGGCLVIGLQSYAQLGRVYGNEGAKELSSLVNTRFLFRQPDPDMARWSAFNLGEKTIFEAQEGISYGANTMRDGISIQGREVKKPVISYSEIINLSNLHCYVRLPGHYPVTKLAFKYVPREDVHEPFIRRELIEPEANPIQVSIQQQKIDKQSNLLEKLSDLEKEIDELEQTELEMD